MKRRLTVVAVICVLAFLAFLGLNELRLSIIVYYDRQDLALIQPPPIAILDTSHEPRTFSPDGNLLACTDGITIELWNVARRQVVHTLKGPKHKTWVYNSWSLQFSPDGKTLLSVGQKGAIVLWNVATGKEVHSRRGYDKAGWEEAISPDGKTIAYAADENRTVMWDAEIGLQRTEIFPKRKDNAMYAHPTALAFSPDSRILAIATDHELKLVDHARDKVIISKENKSYFRNMMFSPDGNTLVTATANDPEGISFWDVSALKKKLTVPDRGIGYGFALSHDGKLLATSGPPRPWSPSGDANVWRVSDGKQVATFHGPHGIVASLAFSPDGTMLAAGSKRGVILWDVSALHDK